MQDSMRIQLLKTMQIDCYIPRVQLPFAKPELIISIDKNPKPQPIKKLANKDSKSADTKAVNQKINVELTLPTTINVQHADKNIAPKLITADEKTDTTNATNSDVKVIIPRFNLQLLKSSNCLILIDLPDSQFLHNYPKLNDLLQNMLKAAGLNPNYETVGELIKWPMFLRAPKKVVDQSSKEATKYISNIITETQKENYPADCVWLMGENAIKFAANPANAWHTPSLKIINTSIEAKRAVWLDMQQQKHRWLHNNG